MTTFNISRLVGVLALAAAASLAAPVTTVPWNGKTGAVSFTYDDARNSHVPNLIAQLDSVGVKATFFVCETGVGGSFTPKLSGWLQAARNGHEVANHTRNHTNITDGNAATTTKDWADHLRSLDTTVRSATFAYPNCAYPGTTGYNGVSAENFIARGCHSSQTTNYAWATQPANWMRVDALIMSPTNNNTGITLLRNSKTQNRWAVILIHDVADPTPDQYSITPASNLQLLKTAIDSGLWIDTYERIGAYYRAHFTMDTAQAVTFGNGKRVQWISPHPRMPSSVPLKVRLDAAVFGDSAVVVQNGRLIPRAADSTYVIDFMKLQMEVYPKGTVAVSPASRGVFADTRARVDGRMLRLNGLSAGIWSVSLHDVTGALVHEGTLRLASDDTEGALALRAAPRTGVHQVTLRRAGNGDVRRLPVMILR